MITLNGKEVTPTIFPDNTSQMWKLPEEILQTANIFHIEWEFEHEREIFDVIGIVKILRCRGLPSERIVLYIPYLPYGRQDKPVSNETTFNREIFLEMLEIVRGHCMIFTVDAHSEVPEWIENKLCEYNIMSVYRELKADIVVFPDNGASRRYSSMFRGMDSFYGSKKRDQKTGYITEYTLPSSAINSLNSKRILIVDDICDGGMTFIMLADALREQGTNDIHLYVSHGIFSKGLTELRRAGIKRFFTYKGEVNETDTNITM